MLKEQIEKISKGIVQYQFFKTKKAIILMGYTGIPEKKARTYFDLGISYLRHGQEKKLPIAIKKQIDVCLSQKMQPLTPKQEDKRKFKPWKRQIKNNIAQTVKKISTPKITQKFEYGVKFENTIKIFDTEKECKAFIEGAELFITEKNYFKIVSVSFDDL